MNALLVIASLGVVSLVAEFANFKKWLMTIVLLGLAAAFGLVVMDWGTSNYYYNEMMVFDNLGLAFTALLVTISILWFFMFSAYFDVEAHQTDRTSLVIFVIAGGVIMSAFNNMAMLFLGIEILSISLYVLAGSKKDSISSTEAAFKYFLMGSFATGFLLFGITLVYGATGSFHLHTISAYLSAHSNDLPAFLYLGVLLMLVGLAFKISAVPFHFWAPDVYEGSPLAITAFMSTVVKIAAIAAFYRMFSICFVSVQSDWTRIVQVMMILTLVIPNITAVYQNNVKRMLAYSSVGHVGYILLAIVTGNSQSSGVIFYYLAAYATASLGAFYVLSIIERISGNTLIRSFNGFFKRNRLVASTMAIALMSLAGIPPLAGFFGKYMVFALAVQEGYIGQVVLAVITSLIGVYYYFRVIVAMFFEPPAGEEILVSMKGRVLLILLILMVFGLGIFPDFFLFVFY